MQATGSEPPEEDGFMQALLWLGIPPPLFWGFVGLLLFMTGDGVESGYLSPYLGERGLSPAAVAFIFTVYGVSAGVGILYGATLAGFVPLSALMPHLAPQHKGEALSLLSLGAGASVWVGPALVGLFFGLLGVAGLMWIFAGLYLRSAVLTLTLPEQRVEAS